MAPPHPTPYTLVKRQLAGVTGVKSGGEKVKKRAEFSLSCPPTLHSPCIMFMTSTLFHLMKSHVTSVRSFLQQFQEMKECSLPGRRQKKQVGRGGEGAKSVKRKKGEARRLHRGMKIHFRKHNT